MKIKFDMSSMILVIVGLSISLLIFASLAPTISNNLLAANYTCVCVGDGTACTGHCDAYNASSNVLASVIVPLITVVFVVGIMIQVLRTAMGKK